MLRSDAGLFNTSQSNGHSSRGVGTTFPMGITQYNSLRNASPAVAIRSAMMGRNQVGVMEENGDGFRPESSLSAAHDTELNLEGQQSGGGQKGKLIGVFIAPVLFMFALSITQITFNIQQLTRVKTSIKSITFIRDVDEALHLVSTERILAAAYFASNHGNLESYGQLQVYRLSSPDKMKYVQSRIVEQVPEYSIKPLADSWQKLEDCGLMSCNNSIKEIVELYDKVISSLITVRDREIEVPQASGQYPMWSTYTGATSLIRIVDILGQQAAITTIKLTLCDMSSDRLTELESLNGKKDIMLRVMENYYKPASTFLHGINDTYNLLYVDSNSAVLPHEPFYNSTCYALDPFTQYLEIAESRGYFNFLIEWCRYEQDVLLDLITDELQGMKTSLTSVIIAYSVALTIITLACLIISVWYSSVIQSMITNMQDITANIGRKTEELASEKKRSEYLLRQMLPGSVVDKLAQGLQVLPELHPGVTIFFSDIVAFEDISNRSDPHQIVEMLNQLYM